MATEKGASITLTPPTLNDRLTSPSPHQFRSRPLGRAVTSGDVSLLPNRRRSSLFSENLSETRRSIRTSTDDLLLPRVTKNTRFDVQHDPSHWHSVPLGLALLPAVTGLFFDKGSAIVTDASLLLLAIVFLNWSVRLPWDWYSSAQATRTTDPLSPPSFDSIAEEDSEDDAQEEAVTSSQEITPPNKPQAQGGKPRHKAHPKVSAARKELRVHEVVALASCFVCPIVGAWLLHAIRSQLTRPSEGLVSNYNLTMFVLASEIRPMQHMVKMVQARTLFLQRTVGDETGDDEPHMDNSKILDLTRRLEEMEAHVADTAENAEKSEFGSPEIVVAQASAQATSDLKKSIQPELDALNRAVRRYEKRTTISALQTEARLQDLETRLRDVVVLAAAAQRNADKQPRNFIVILVNWACGAVVIPLQYVMYILTLPSKALHLATSGFRRLVGSKRSRYSREPKAARHGGNLRPRERKAKAAT